MDSPLHVNGDNKPKLDIYSVHNFIIHHDTTVIEGNSFFDAVASEQIKFIHHTMLYDKYASCAHDVAFLLSQLMKGP